MVKYKSHFMAISGCLRKELKVQTPFQAIEKWFEMNLETFSQKLINLNIKLL